MANNIRVDLELKDGSFTSGMLRANQSLSSFRKELARVDPHFRKMNASSKNAVVGVQRSDKAHKSLMGTMRDLTIVAGGLTMAFHTMTGAGSNLIGQITNINAQIERMRFQMLAMSTSTKPMQEAANSVDFLRQKAKEAPFSLRQLSDSFVKMKATGIDPMNGSLTALADGIAAFGGSDQELHRVSLGIRQMAGKSVIQMEELRQQLGEAMPNAMNVMARSMGVSIAELVDAIATGRVEAQSALSAFFDELDRTYGGAAQHMIESFAGQVSLLQANLQILATQGGLKRFFEEEKEGMVALNDFLQGADAAKFASNIGDALAAVVRGFKTVVQTAFEFRSEIGTLAKVLAAGIGLRLLGSSLSMVTTSFRSAALSATAFRSSMALASADFMMGARGIMQGQHALTSFQIAAGGAGRMMSTLGGTLLRSIPYVGLLVSGVALLAGRFDILGSSTRQAYEELEEFGAKSREEANKIIDDERARRQGVVGQREQDIESLKRQIGQTESYIRALQTSGTDSEAKVVQNAKDQLQRLLGQLGQARSALDESRQSLVELAENEGSLVEEAGEAEEQRSFRRYQRGLRERMRETRQSYARAIVDAEKAYNKARKEAEDGDESSLQARERYRERLGEITENQTEDVIKLLDDEEAAIQKKMETAQGQERDNLERHLQLILDMQKEAQRNLRRNRQEGITLVPETVSNEQKIERGGDRLRQLREEVKGLEASLAGAGSEFARLQFRIERGDYGELEGATEAVRQMHQALLDATQQKEALDKLMQGKNRAEGDIEAIEQEIRQRRLELEFAKNDREMNAADRFLHQLRNGFFEGLGPVENIRRSINEVTGALGTQGSVAQNVGRAMRENTFGQGTIDKINAVREAIRGIGEDMGALGSSDAFSISDLYLNRMVGTGGTGGRSGGTGNAMLDLIARSEGTVGRPNSRGYNTTLGYGAFTGGQRDLVNMTLREILKLQREMLNHPDNDFNSSALGKYQIVGTTLGGRGLTGQGGLIKQLGLDLDQKFDADLQDQLAKALLKRRGANVEGLRNEWEGLRRVAGPEILRAFGQRDAMPESMPTFDFDEMVRRQLEATGNLENRGESASAELESLRVRELEQAREDQVRKLEAELEGLSASLGDVGTGNITRRMMERIRGGEFGGNLDPQAEQYREILRLAREVDATEDKLQDKRQAQTESASQRKTLDRQRLEIQQQIVEANRRAEDPDYQGQSRDLRRLTEQLDDYVENIRIAAGEDSESFRNAKRFREDLINSQRRLNAAESRADFTQETRQLEDSLRTQSQMRRVQMQRDLATVDSWLERQRAAGQDEVEIVREAERRKTAIRKKFAQETSPVTQQMKEWADFSGTIKKKTTGWLDSFSSGLAGLITGTGDLRGAINGMLSDIVTSQVRFLWSSMAGDKTQAVGGKVGSAIGVKHGGGIAGQRGGRTRKVSMANFANAPRYHTGDIVGPNLRQGEVPVIAKRGEGIFTPEQMKAMAPVNSQSSQAVTINAPITVEGGGGTPEQNDDLAKKMSQEMEKSMRGVVVDELRRQQRPGNMIGNSRGGRR